MKAKIASLTNINISTFKVGDVADGLKIEFSDIICLTGQTMGFRKHISAYH